MNTRCKFQCNHVTQTGDTKSAHFSAVVSGSEENKDFWKYTPAGNLTLEVLNPNVNFEQGKEYYLDIIPVAQ